MNEGESRRTAAEFFALLDARTEAAGAMQHQDLEEQDVSTAADPAWVEAIVRRVGTRPAQPSRSLRRRWLALAATVLCACLLVALSFEPWFWVGRDSEGQFMLERAAILYDSPAMSPTNRVVVLGNVQSNLKRGFLLVRSKLPSPAVGSEARDALVELQQLLMPSAAPVVPRGLGVPYETVLDRIRKDDRTAFAEVVAAWRLAVGLMRRGLKDLPQPDADGIRLHFKWYRRALAKALGS